MGRGNVTILVTGATGQQGGAVTRHLLADGWCVRALVRNPTRPAARALAAEGAELAVGDLTNRASLDAVVAGTYGVFSVQTPSEVGAAGEEAEGRNIADAARAAGVRHFVYSSVIGADRESNLPWVDSKHHVENYLRTLDIPLTILRPATFMENLLVQKDDIAQGHVEGWRAPNERQAWIAVDDIGRFVALAFEQPDEWIGRTTEIAGDNLTGFEEATALSIGFDTTITYEQLAPSEDLPAPRAPAPGSPPAREADMAWLREQIPDLRSMLDWAAEQNLFARVV